MRRLLAGCAWVAIAFTQSACNDSLSVANQANPDIDRALSTASGIEQVISTGYQQIHLAQNATNITPQTNAFGLESYGSVANFGMNTRGGIPRSPVQNERGNPTANENYTPFRDIQKVARHMANAIQALDTLVARQGTTGSPARDARARAWAFFTMGVAHGSLALIYDSLAVVTKATPPREITPLVSYAVAAAAALENLDSAIAIASSAAVLGDSGSFVTNSWINGNTISRSQFIRIARSFKARFRASVARTPAARAGVDWPAVIADATNGITADLSITLTNSGGWSHAYLTQMYSYSGWHLAPVPLIGFADSSSAASEYDAWLAEPILANRNGAGANFLLIRSADLRFPSGNTRAAQTAASGCAAGNTNAACRPSVASGAIQTNGRPYYRARLQGGDDTRGDQWAQSAYDHYRFRYLTLGNANRDGLWPTMTRAEIEMLAAEGYIRTGNFGAAAALVDRTRTTQGGLPSVAALNGGAPAGAAYDPWGGMAVPGGNSCVPRVPKNGAAGRQCGNLFEAMKWEKRLETAFTGWAQWYIDARGWGDLPEGTALSWPVPYQELDARTTGNSNFYSLGGSTSNQGAPKGSYGW